MTPRIEREANLAHVSIQLGSVDLDRAGEASPPHAGYCICQRLSDNHAPLRIGNMAAREAFSRVRSVGLLPPGQLVQLYPVGKPFRVLNCMFERDYFERVTETQVEHWAAHMRDLVSIRHRRLEVLMQEIQAELVQPGFGQELLIEAAATMIVVELARYGRVLERKTSKNGGGQGLAPWQLRRIQERLSASLEAGYPNLGELAGLCGISQSHLMRSFKISTGWQVHKYIAEDRLNAAKRLLASGRHSAKEVSARLGFASPAYFATAFRRMTGKTPSEYRRQTQGLGLRPN
jgi:AraC family transcriptional regulator